MTRAAKNGLVVLVGVVVTVLVAVFGGAFRAGEAIAESSEARATADKAHMVSEQNARDIVELKTDVRYIVKGIDEIKSKLND